MNHNENVKVKDVIDKDLMLSVHMITYNHEKYIEQAIKGVLMQETNFDFELIIADDCSPDDTAKIVEDIIKNHPKGYKIKYFRQDTNIGMNANAAFAFANCKGKYVAICEGDDYWTDPLKLYKQVDFLESNSEYGLIHTDSLAYNQSKGEFEILKKMKNKYKSFFEELMFGNAHIYTLTVCFRKIFWLDYIKEIQPASKNWLMGDLPLWLFISKKSKIFFINELTSVYRIQEESASNTKNINKYLAFIESAFEIRLFFLKKYCNNNLKLKKNFVSVYLYRRLIGNVIFKGDEKQFFNFLYEFYLNNNSIKLFFSSFYQILKKIKSYIVTL